MRTIPIERIPAPDEKTFLEEIAPRNLPFLFKGVTAGWKAAEWTPEYLKRKVGAAKVAVRLQHSEIAVIGQGSEKDTLELPFDQALDGIVPPSGGRATHLLYSNPLICEAYYPLLEDLVIPSYVDLTKLLSASFWVSGRGPRARLHFDSLGCHNLNVQVKGQKRVRLFSPEDGEFLYPNPASEGPGENFVSRVEIFDPDLAQFPDVEKATCYEGIMEEGDALYHPAIWSHAFKHTGSFNVNVNFWWLQLAYEPSGQFRRWSFLEYVTSYILELQRRTGKQIAAEDIPKDVVEFIEGMEQHLLRVRARPMWALADEAATARRSLEEFVRTHPTTRFVSSPLPPRLPLLTER